jgi:hypothetical protein
MATRLLAETTGRRPLPSDLAGLAVLAGLISYTPLGWVMGFGLAVAIYIDDRMSGATTRPGLLAALGAAVAASVVVNLSDALPETAWTIDPILAASSGALALLAVARSPVDPVSFVDSRSRRFLRSDRVHAARALAGVVLFAGSLIESTDSRVVVPMAMVLAVVLASEEVERLWRQRAGRR